MRSIKQLALGVALGALLAPIGFSFAQQNADQPARPAEVKRDVNVTVRNGEVQADAVKTTSENLAVVRGHDIMGMHVQNSAGQDLGSIKDLVIDLHSGKVRYVAISFGGFLGIGDKLFAVPFNSLQLRQNATDNTRYFVMNVDKKTLENAPGFDANHWPDFASPRFGESNDRFFQQTPAVQP